MATTELLGRMHAREFLISVQIDPPEGPNIDAFKTNLDWLIKAGVRVVDVNASRRVSLDSTSLAIELKRAGLDVIPHLTTRDNTLPGLQRQVMTAYSLAEIRDYLLIAGDPYTKAQYQIPGIFEVSIVEAVNKLNSEFRDKHRLGVSFGASINQYRDDKSKEIKLIMDKQQAGTDFFMSQPVFDGYQIEELLSLQDRYITRPLLVGVWPILQVRTLGNLKDGRVSGVIVPDEVYDKGQSLIEDEVKLKAWGIKRAGDLIDKLKASGKVAGVYIISPLRDPRQLSNLIARVLT